MLARSSILLRRQPLILRTTTAAVAIRAQSTTSGPVNPFPSTRPGPNDAGTQPHEAKGELIPQETGDIDAHRKSGLTTSHPSPEIIAADVLNDAPAALHHRTVRIFQPTKTTMQSGKMGNNHWRIDFDVLEGGGRWENSLMGWGSSADYMQGSTMKFKTQEDAIHFAEKQGWNYHVDKAHKERIPPKSYAENFVHIPGKLRRYQTK
ncbi:hypothetical protein NliqN6_3436 [Naganishia liquefaciens]|uniref:NADH dehydrogenase [ubiquinone] iron-sulfur protein 4, mitochondrial n=1 Tax=Naganishia liquefaciens TaxID=104408 RepID=A0A8H3TVP5_9TREE|nr:hypothetical protein NliqN6_3436 [Naganishia liquefaciens]